MLLCWTTCSGRTTRPLELLAWLAEPLEGLPVLAVAGTARTACRASTAAPAAHRAAARRGGWRSSRWRPWRTTETAALVAQRARRARRRPSLVRGRSTTAPQGVPFFVEELARALRATDALKPRDGTGCSSPRAGRCRCRTRCATPCSWRRPSFSREARDAAEAAAVAGEAFDLEVVAALGRATPDWRSWPSAASSPRTASGGRVPPRPDARRVLRGGAPGSGGGRSTGAWPRRSRPVAAAAESGDPLARRPRRGPRPGRAAARGRRVAGGARPRRRGAGRPPRAGAVARGRETWSGASRPSAVRLKRRAVGASWARRRAPWREIRHLAAAQGARERMAVAERRLAAVHNLTGRPRGGLSARRTAADAFAAAGRPAEAAVERLAIAEAQVAGGELPGRARGARRPGGRPSAAGRHDLPRGRSAWSPRRAPGAAIWTARGTGRRPAWRSPSSTA